MQTLFMRSDRRIIQNGQTSVTFTPTEWTIIARLNQTPRALVSPKQLMRAITSQDSNQTDASTYLRTFIFRIKFKLAKIELNDWLTNQYSKGYLAEYDIPEKAK